MVNFPTSKDELVDNTDEALADHINTLQDKVGTGSSNNAPADNKLLKGTGAGTSEWSLDFKDEDDMASNSNSAVPSQQSVKAYHDNDMPTGDVVGTTDTQTLTNKTLDTPTFIGVDGWVDADESWSYSSWDDTNGVSTAVITVPSDATTKYQEGMRVKFDQTTDGTKYGIITKVESTTLTVFINTDYDFDDETITNPYYSPMKAPFGFDLDHDKWVVETIDETDDTQSSPTSGTWYNLGSVTLDVPIGSWNLGYQVSAWTSKDANYCDLYSTLSTGGTSETDSEYTIYAAADGDSGSNIANIVGNSVVKEINLTTKDTYYLNFKVGQASQNTIRRYGSRGATIIRAICAYL
jgi:hypothetical protein